MSKIPRVLETTFETYSVESKLGEGGTCPASTILVPLLRQLTAIADPQKRSIKLVGDYLSQHGAEPAEIVPVLKHLNRLRQGYPVHGDRADSVLEAHEFFRLPYPVEDWRVAWRASLLNYLDALKKLLDALRDVGGPTETEDEGSAQHL